MKPQDNPHLPDSGEVDKIWKDIRSTLASTAMKNMTIPQAKVFSAEATEYIGGHVKKLVDVELAAHTSAAIVAALEELLKRLEVRSLEEGDDGCYKIVQGDIRAAIAQHKEGMK